MNIWEKWDRDFDNDGFKKDIEEAAENNGGSYEEVPLGEYEVKIKKMEMVENKKQKPMLTIQFEILEGPYKGQLIFYNQVLLIDGYAGLGVHKANVFMDSLDCGVDIQWENWCQYDGLIQDVFKAIDGTFEYNLRVTSNSKGFKEYEILDIYEI